MHSAASNGHLDIVKYLMENRADVNAKGENEVNFGDEIRLIFAIFCRFRNGVLIKFKSRLRAERK